MAYRGLYSYGISPKDAEYYLTIIKNRVQAYNGSEWIVKSYRNLMQSKKRKEALQVLTENLYLKQDRDYPVSTWKTLTKNTNTTFQLEQKVHHIMNTDIFSVDKRDSLELVIHMMVWKKIHHMPVIDSEKDLIGLLSWSDVKEHINEIEESTKSVQNFMVKSVITTSEEMSIVDAKKLMKKHDITCLPVIRKNKLIGIITSNDF